MLIEVKSGIFWDTNAETQSIECYEWLNNDIIPNLAMSLNDKTENLIYPEFDVYQRPIKWNIETETWVMEYKRIYIEEFSPSWALDSVSVIITKKDK